MSEYDDMTNTQPYWEDLQPRRRQCRIGDTISTVRAVVQPPDHLHVSIQTQEGCDAANLLMQSGGWRVSMCGRCGDFVEDCACDFSDA